MLGAQLRLTLCAPWTVAQQAPLSTGISQARILKWATIPLSRASSQPRIEPRSPAMEGDSLLSEPPRKPPGYYIWKMIYFTKAVKLSQISSLV